MPYHPEIPLLRIYPEGKKKIRTQKDIPTMCVFIHIYTVEYYSVIKKKEILPLGTTWMGLEGTSVSCSVMSDSLQPHGLQPTRLPSPWDSPGKNTGEDSHCLLQGIFLTQGSNSGLLHCRKILYHLSYREVLKALREVK